jgi:hypothetical protein
MRRSICLAWLVCATTLLAEEPSANWARHTIDDSARGADGVRLADANGDGHLDIATGWEEAGLVRLYLNPGTAKAKQPWPQVTVGKVKSPEDAVLVDLDGDGGMDIVSCCEGNTRSVFVHWGPADKTKQLDPAAWQTEAIPALAGKQMAMYCLPLQIDGKHGIDLAIGGKGSGAQIGWLEAPARPRDLADWRWHPLYTAGWTMTIAANDLDGDGDPDLLASDRKGKTAGCLWLENPGPKGDLATWNTHRIGPTGPDVMFLDHADLDGDKLLDVLVPTASKRLFFHRRAAHRQNWETQELPFPSSLGRGKGVRVCDVDLNGKMDLVVSSENYEGTNGLVWMSRDGVSPTDAWRVQRIAGPAGPKGMKMDDVQLADLDGDGDLDVLTTEERTGFGVCWFENPTR